MAPEGQDNVKDQACLVCKRNSLLPLTLVAGFAAVMLIMQGPHMKHIAAY
jgi:hypothetical protein